MILNRLGTVETFPFAQSRCIKVAQYEITTVFSDFYLHLPKYMRSYQGVPSLIGVTLLPSKNCNVGI